MPMIMQLLEALLESWLAAETTVDICNDPEKVVLLKRVFEEWPDAEPTPFVRDFYEKVFLYDVWNEGRSAA